jgi:hypothetical protein
MGKRVFDKVVYGSYELNMSNFNTEIYFIKVENKQGVMIGKVIKK